MLKRTIIRNRKEIEMPRKSRWIIRRNRNGLVFGFGIKPVKCEQKGRKEDERGFGEMFI